MAHFYGSNTCDANIANIPQNEDYITHVTIAEELSPLKNIICIQISTCYRSLSMYYVWDIMEEFCQNEHDIEYTITFYPDYQKKIRITGITIENLPIKLPDAKARQFYNNYVILIGNIYYPGYRYENKHFITGTRVYSCNEITNHILRHIISLEDTYEFATATNHTTKKKTYKPPPNQKKALSKTNSTKDYNKKHNLNKYKKKYKQND